MGLAENWHRIGELVQDWHKMGRDLAKIIICCADFFTDWHRIGIRLADWSWIGNGLVEDCQIGLELAECSGSVAWTDAGVASDRRLIV